MVVVAIIGILSAVAVPNFKKYQAKAKTSEAKMQLAAIYTAEISALNEYDTFGSCLKMMGFDPSADAAQRYYTVGINGTDQNAVLGGAGLDACTDAENADGTSWFAAGKKVASQAVCGSTDCLQAGTGATPSLFTASAGGYIMQKTGIAVADADKWTINEKKQLKQNVVGY